MFSRSVVFVCVFLLVALAHSDAKDAYIFGLKKRMSISEIRALGFGDVKWDKRGYFIVKNPKMISGADEGRFFGSSSDGLLEAVFIWRFEANIFEARKKYNELRNMVKKKYRKGEEKENIQANNKGNMSNGNISPTMKGEHISFWEKTLDPENKWELAFIQIVKKETSEMTTVTVTYQFRD